MKIRLLLVYAALWLSLLAVGAFISAKFIISSQVAFFSSLIVLFATYQSYKKRVTTRVQNDRDEILAMQKEQDEEDELWGEDQDENLNAQNVAQEKTDFSLKEEKERLKRQKIGIKELNLTAAFVPYRLIAYGVLIIGFLVLKRREMLDISGFLIGLGAMPIGAFAFGIASKNERI